MGCMSSKDVSPKPQPLLPAAEMRTVEDIIANAKASGSDTLNLAQNKANPDEELEEGWLVERGLDLEDGLPDSAFACASVTTFTMKAAQLPALPPGIGLMVQLVSLDLSENALAGSPSR